MFDEAWRWTRFTKESGLPSEHIYNLAEANDGTVWVATTSGIAYYDGFRWRYVSGTENLPPGRFITFVATDDNRILATIGGGCFIGDRNGFHLLSPMKIDEAVPFGKDSLLLLSDRKLFVFSNEEIFPFDSARSWHLGEVLDVWRTNKGVNWMATLDELYQWEKGGWVSKLRASNPWLKISYRVFHENKQGTAVVVIDQPLEMWGMWEWNSSDKVPKRSYSGKSAIRWAALNENNDLLLIHESGTKRIRIKGEWFNIKLNQLATRDIEFIQYRNNGDIWFGTQHGLYLYKHSSPVWTYVRNEGPDSRKSVNEIVVARDSLLWVATSDGVEIHYPDGSAKAVSKIDGMELYMVTGLIEDQNGHIWISSGGSFDGAYKWDGKRWTWYGDGTPLSLKRIHKIRQDRKGRLWFLSIWPRKSLLDSTSSLGADVYDDGKFVEHWGLEKGLASKQLYSFAEGLDGSLWFGTVDGLSRYKKGTWKHWKTGSAYQPNLLGRVFSIAIDKNDRVWFGNRTSGLWFVDERDSLELITTEDGLINNEVWDLRVDSLNRLWITTGGGLSCYDHGTWTSVDSKTGLLDSELWPVVPVGNKVYVGSRGGVSILDLTAIQYPNPIVVIEKPLIQERTVTLRWRPLAYWGTAESDDILTRHRINRNAWSKWTKTHGATVENLDAGDYTVEVQALGFFSKFDHRTESASFTIEQKFHEDSLFLFPLGGFAFLALWLGATAIVRKKRYDEEIHESEAKFRAITETTSSAIFIYDAEKVLFANASAELLTGYSNEEFLAMSMRTVLHPDLSQTFGVISLAFNSDPGPNRMEMKIQRKTGEERWVDYMEGRIEFHGVAAVVGTAFDITERKLAEGEIIANQSQLRRLASELAITEERERKRMAAFLHDAIGQTLALCKLKVGTLQHTMKIPEVEKSLQEIRGFLDSAIQNTRSLTSELSPPILHELGLVPAIEWIAEKMQEQSSIRFQCEDDGKVKPVSDECGTLLFRAVRELLLNAVKHSKATKVIIAIARRSNTICITVADNGTGEAATPQSTRDGGFGLFNIRERLHHFGGSMSISAVRGTGTKIMLTCPLQLTVDKD